MSLFVPVLSVLIGLININDLDKSHWTDIILNVGISIRVGCRWNFSELKTEYLVIFTGSLSLPKPSNHQCNGL